MSIAEAQPSTALAVDTAVAPLFRKIAWRLVPFLSLCYLVSQIDRVNISFAKFQMGNDLGITDTIYGLGAGIFFLGYCLFEVPSNIVLKRIGARLWLGIIIFTWGLLSAATMFVSTPTAFCVMRFFLGVAEAGFFPGVIYYMTFWFTSRQRGQMTAIFMASIAVSGFVVGPVSGAIMHSLDGWHGLKGWQLIFFLEGAPAMLLGIMCWLYLDSKPAQASWLSTQEKSLIARLLEQEARAVPNSGEHGALRVAVASPAAWGLSLIYLCYGTAFFGIVFWLPTMIKIAGVDDPFTIGLLTSIPWGASVVAMIAVAAYADRRQNSRRVLVVLSVISAVGFSLTLASGNITVALAALTLAMASVMASLPVFWNLPTRLFSGAAAAVVIAMITSIGNFAGFFAPYLVGWIKDTFGTLDIAMYIFVAAMLLATPLLFGLPARIDAKPAGGAPP